MGGVVINTIWSVSEPDRLLYNWIGMGTQILSSNSLEQALWKFL